ncbi:hypothetical protein Tco_1478532 [Tanacetum coccineum]
MSDSEDSIVTYTRVSSPFGDSSDVGSPGVDGPPVMPEDPYAYIVAAYQAPPSPDYMPGPEEPQSPPPLDFVPEPMYPEYMPLKDEILLAEEQPLPTAALPTADSPGYVPESDPDYPADRDDDDEEEEEPSRDDASNEDEDEEEEEHPAPAYSVPPIYHRPEITLPPQKRLGIDLGPRCEVGKSLAAAAARPIGGRRADYGFVNTVDAKISRRRAEEVSYGIRDAWVDLRDAAEEVALTTLKGVNTRVTELAAVQEQDTQDIYGMIEDTHDQEALVSREAWGRSMEVSYMARS